MKTWALIFLLIASYSIPVSAQGENNVWVFGRHIGLNFNSGTPVPFYSAISNADYPNGSVCDAHGNLLFYTNGLNIWDRNGDTMSNGKRLMNGYGAPPHNSLIIPFPGDTNRYYVLYIATGFGLFGATGNDSLYYSVVDMRLNGGKGDVVAGLKDHYLTNRVGLLITVVPGENCNIWLITHEYGGPIFRVFEITTSGINIYPKREQVGTFFGSYTYITGDMRVSPDNKTIAIVSPNMLGGVELYDFNNITGQLSNNRILDSPANNWYYSSVCFSPDNSRLYIGGTYGHGAFQFDLTQPTLQGIRNSKTLITASVGQAAGDDMEIGPDGKIYLSASDASGLGGIYTTMDRIDNPNGLGNACNYTQNAIYLGGLFPPPPPAPQEQASVQYGLPNRVMVMAHDTVRRSFDTILCKGASMNLSTPAGIPPYTYLWQDGTTTDTFFTASQPGIYYAAYHNICKERTDTFHVIASTLNVDLGNDTSICVGKTLVLNATNTGAHYLWSDGSAGPTLTIDTAGTYGVAAYLQGCTATDFIKIKNVPNFTLFIGNDTILCGAQSFTIQANIADASYTWQDGSTMESYTTDMSGSYSVTVDRQGCVNSDTINVNYIILHEYLGNDTTVCSEQPVHVLLNTNAPGEASIMWSDGSVQSSLLAQDTGTYWVKITERPCSVSDTIDVHSAPCDCTIAMPSAFSPNGDGKNDLFRAIAPPGCSISNYKLVVYNRWGQQVFTTEQLSEGWDGTYKGVPAEMGTYEYMLKYTGGTQMQQHTQKGDVTLIR